MNARHALLALSLAASAAACAGSQRRPQAPNLLALDAALANRFVPAAERSDVVARIRVRVPETASLRRPPINLSLVVDTSGSMEGRAIDDALKAVSQATAEFAARRMNRSVQRALSGRKLTEL